MLKIKRLLKSFRYAIRGLAKVLREEQNLQVQFLIALIVVGLGIFLKIERIEWCILILIICLVVLMEIVNSAVERVSDILKPRMSSYVKEIKDIMAAAVMLASLMAVVVGGIIFFPYIFELIKLF